MIRFVSIPALASLLLLSATPAFANDGYIDANVHILVGADVASAEYSWAKGDLSGFGFVDKSLNSDFIITDHEVRAQVVEPVYVSAEVGYNRFGGERMKVGVGVKLGDLPVVRDNFVYLNAYAQHTVHGSDADQIVGVSWGTKDLRLTDDVSIYASGFADFKSSAPDVIQPQLWLKFDKVPVEVGGEVSIFGKQTDYSLSVKFKF